MKTQDAGQLWKTPNNGMSVELEPALRRECPTPMLDLALRVFFSALMFVAAALLLAGTAHADATADGAVKLDLSSYIYEIQGLDVSGLGYSTGSKLEAGDAVAVEGHSPEFGYVLGSTGLPWGIAGAYSTGSEAFILTNELDHTFMNFNLNISYDYGATTSIGGPQDSARLGLVIDGEDAKGHFTIAEFVLKGNDHRADSNQDFTLYNVTLGPGQSVSLDLHYELVALATTAPEPSTLLLLGSGILGLGGLLRKRMIT